MSQKLQYELSAKDRTKAALRSFKKGLGGASKALLSLKAAVSGLVAGLALLRLAQATKSAVNFGAQLQITSDKIGVTVESLQAFRIAAESAAGVQSNVMDMALQRFSRRVGEAQKGTGELKGSLQELGIELKNADGSFKSVEEVLFEYADGVAAAANSSEQLLYSFKAFDSEGAVLVGILKQGGAALREQYNKALESGAILTKGAAQQSKVLNAELAIQGKIISTQLKGVLLELGGILLHVTKAITKVTKAFRDLTRTETSKFIDTIGEMGESELIQNIETFSKKLEEAAKNKASYDGLLSKLNIYKSDNYITASMDVQKFTLILEALKAQLMELGSGSGASKGFFGGLADGLKNVERNLKSTKQLGMDFAKTIETNMVAAFDSIIEGTKSLSEGLKDLGRILIKEAMKMIIYRMIIAPFTSAFGGFLDGIGVPAPPQKMQYGGSVQKGKPYIVGESGMEMFVPQQSGSIIPNHKLGGSGTIVQNINISTGVAATVRSEIISLLPSIAEVSKGAMVDSQLRGQL